MTLLEMQERLIANCGERFSSSVLWRFFDRHDITFKKSPRMPRNAAAMIDAAPLANLVIRRLGGNADRQEVGGRLNNRAENSRQPFRLRELAMQRFRSMKTLQKFSSVHAEVHNHFNQERHLVTRQGYKQRRYAALAEWRALAA